MKHDEPALARLTDDDLVSAVKRLAQGEREATADLVASLAEFDDLITQARAQARRSRLRKRDVARAVARARARK